MKKILIIAAAIIAALVQPSFAENKPAPKERLHLYLLIGQSNMAGRAKYDGELAKPIPRAHLLNGKDEWEEAKNPLNIYSTIRKGEGMQKLGPGYGFATAMLKKDSSNEIGLIVNAKGGTKIEQWKKGTKFYDEAIRRTKIAMKDGTLKGILWHQGESNQGNPDEYLEQLETLVKDLRKDLGVKDLPFIAGQVNDVPKINEAIAELPKKVDATSYVSSEGLKCTDRWHFDTASALLLGERYAEEMQKLLK